jgi:hypothetical protein
LSQKWLQQKKLSPISRGKRGRSKSCRARTRSYDEELKQEQLTKARTQIGTQVLREPDLAKIVTAWPKLAPALKAAVLAVIASAKK